MKIIGQMVCGPGEADKYLKYSLDTFKRLCDDAFIVTCNAGPKEKKMIKIKLIARLFFTCNFRLFLLIYK